MAAAYSFIDERVKSAENEAHRDLIMTAIDKSYGTLRSYMQQNPKPQYLDFALIRIYLH